MKELIEKFIKDYTQVVKNNQGLDTTELEKYYSKVLLQALTSVNLIIDKDKLSKAIREAEIMFEWNSKDGNPNRANGQKIILECLQTFENTLTSVKSEQVDVNTKANDIYSLMVEEMPFNEPLNIKPYILEAIKMGIGYDFKQPSVKSESAEELLNKYPSTKLGLDDFYGRQTTLKAMHDFANNSEQKATQLIVKLEKIRAYFTNRGHLYECNVITQAIKHIDIKKNKNEPTCRINENSLSLGAQHILKIRDYFTEWALNRTGNSKLIIDSKESYEAGFIKGLLMGQAQNIDDKDQLKAEAFEQGVAEGLEANNSEAMKQHAIGFGKWIDKMGFYIDNFNKSNNNNWISDHSEYSGCAYTDEELYNEYLNTLNNK